VYEVSGVRLLSCPFQLLENVPKVNCPGYELVGPVYRTESIFEPTQVNLPPVPLPSSAKLIDVSDATSAAVVCTELEVAAGDVPFAFVAVTANV
jgi:hypothetical protein